MMKTFPLFATALVVALSVPCAIVSGHPSHGPDAPKMALEFGYRAFTDMSPVPRGLRRSDDVASGRLSKRQCGTGDLYCPATSFCCNPGYSCCGYTFCCPTGYACPVSGPCYQADVVTVTYTSTNIVTSNAVSTVYSTSTSLVIQTSTGYTTVTTHIKTGVSTSTILATVTTTQVMKRGAVAAPTPAMTETHDVIMVAPKPSMEPSLVEGQTPIADLLRRAFANVGLLEERAITSYQTIAYTSTSYRYSYYTVNSVVTSTSNTAVLSTATSTIVDAASTTTTVTSTITTTITSSNGHVSTTTPTPGPSPISTSPGPSPVSPSPGPSPISTSPGPSPVSPSPGPSPISTSPGPSPVSPSPGPSPVSPSPGPTSPVSTDTDSGLSQGAKIGIGVGAGLAAVLILSLVGFCLWRRRHRRNTIGGGASNRDTILSQPESLAGVGAAGAAAGIGATNMAYHVGNEKVPVSPISSTAVPSPPPMHQAYWPPQKAYELPQQTYPPPQQTYPPPHQAYELPQQTYPSPQQTHPSPQQVHELPQKLSNYDDLQIDQRY